MSRMSEMFVLGQRVSLAAAEEASRYDLPDIDVDHLLLALLVGGGPAGELLRGQGLSLEAARRATEQVRHSHIARLGVLPPPARPGPIRDPSIGGTGWTRRALDVVAGNEDRSDLGLLVTLLAEPSGVVVEVLAAADVDIETLGRSLADADGSPAGAPRPTSARDAWSVSQPGFVPAPVAQVWALLTDPTRRHQWDPAVGAVEVLGPDLWEIRWVRTGPDGRPVRRRRGHDRAHARLTAYEPGQRVEWEVTVPDRPRSGRYRLATHLRAAPGGTAVELTCSWPPGQSWRRWRQALLRPWTRLVFTQTLVQHAAGISRALR